MLLAKNVPTSRRRLNVRSAARGVLARNSAQKD